MPGPPDCSLFKQGFSLRATASKVGQSYWQSLTGPNRCPDGPRQRLGRASRHRNTTFTQARIHASRLDSIASGSTVAGF